MPHIPLVHAWDTDRRVLSLSPSMAIVGSMYGGRSPISAGWYVSLKAALTVHVDGQMFLSLLLSPVPDVDAPLSMMTLLECTSRERRDCDDPDTWSRLKSPDLFLPVESVDGDDLSGSSVKGPRR